MGNASISEHSTEVLACHRQDNDEDDDETIDHCGAQFDLHSLWTIPANLEISRAIQDENRSSRECQDPSQHRAQQASQAQTHIGYAASRSIVDQLVARPWRIACKSYCEVDAAASNNLPPLQRWQVESPRDQPWHGVAAFCVVGSPQTGSPKPSTGSSMSRNDREAYQDTEFDLSLAHSQRPERDGEISNAGGDTEPLGMGRPSS